MVDRIWAEGPCHRQQRILLGLSLDEQLPGDALIRQVDVLLGRLNWAPWEKHYSVGGRGRPPIHPRQLAGCILHGMMNRIRSSRDLEAATRFRLDFRWFLDGLTIDHTTISTFRNRFGDELKELLGEMNREARRLVREMTGEDSSAQVALDGTTIRADSDRHGARTAYRLEQSLQQLQREFEQVMSEMEMLDAMDALDKQTVEQLEKQMARLEADRRKLEQALKTARERDGVKKAKDGKNATAVRVPVTDPESALMPNKDGGHAPNYIATAAADTHTGLITHSDIAEGGDEAGVVAAALEDTEAALGQKPDKLLCDSNFASGENLSALEDEGVDMLSPSPLADPNNPARRADPTEPIEPEQLEALLKRKGKLSKTFFAYDTASDLFRCPMGRSLPFKREVKRADKTGRKHPVREYQCKDCSDCPLAGKCLSRNAKARTVSRDRYEPCRERLAQRMDTEQARNDYAKRAPTIEGVFGTIKGAMGIRAFWTRGMDRVRTEWRWVCTAYSLKKLTKLLAQAPAGPSDDRCNAQRPAAIPMSRQQTLRCLVLQHRAISPLKMSLAA
jgi:transposase